MGALNAFGFRQSKKYSTFKAQAYVTNIGGVAHAVPLNGNYLSYQSVSFTVYIQIPVKATCRQAPYLKP